MPPRKFSALDTDASGAGVTPAPSAVTDEVAQAEARAKAARARAVRLRQLAEAASSHEGAGHDAEDANDEPDDGLAPGEEDDETPRRRRWRRRLRWRRRTLTLAAGVVVICASLAASGYVRWYHRDVAQQRERSAQYATAARDAVTAMMTIDPGKAREEMQRFSDATTGVFKASILMSAEDFVKAVEQSKVRIKGAVQDVAVESMTKDSALVLVVAKSELTKADQAKPESRSWRIVVHVERDGSQLKVSKFEFVP
jgi:Mce-associated membrane protein